MTMCDTKEGKEWRDGVPSTRVIRYVPAVHDGEFASVPELVTLTGDSHAAKGGATEVEVVAGGATGALVRYDNGDGPPGANGLVKALDLVAGPTAFPSFEQNWSHCSNSGP